MKPDDFRCLCCKKKRDPRVHEMDRDFRSVMEMTSFDDEGNILYGKKHASTQTNTKKLSFISNDTGDTWSSDEEEKKGIDV